MTLRSLLLFSARFLAVFAVLAPLWSFLSLFYAGILVGIGNGTLSALGYPPMLSLGDRQIFLTVISQNIQVSTAIPNLYGVPLLLALIWAVPGLRTRGRLSLVGLGGLAFMHWLNLLSQAGMLLARTVLGKFLSERLFLLSALGDMLLPALVGLWVVLHRQEGCS